MAKRYIFKKWDQSQEPTKCWGCPNKTLFYITDRKTGENFFTCVECALKKYKIKRLKGLLNKYPIRKKSLISVQNSLIKKQEDVVIVEGLI